MTAVPGAPGLFCVFPAPALESAISPRISKFLILEKKINIWVPDVLVAAGLALSWASQWMYMDVHTCVYR